MLAGGDGMEFDLSNRREIQPFEDRSLDDRDPGSRIDHGANEFGSNSREAE
jgi:hypothetical protein